MVAEFVTGLGIFKSLFDIAKGLKDMNDATVRNSAVIELQEGILTAQAQQTALTEQIEKVRSFEKWEAEKQRYILTDYGSGTFAYALKPEKAEGEPPHRLCATCYQQGIKSILQHKGSHEGLESVGCLRCKQDIWFGAQRPQRPIEYPETGIV